MLKAIKSGNYRELGLHRPSGDILACLQMEGANLYDVFQKISKGDYQPLPQDMFSSTLRGLVVGVLSLDLCMLRLCGLASMQPA